MIAIKTFLIIYNIPNTHECEDLSNIMRFWLG
jgi:hypothetical protein